MTARRAASLSNPPLRFWVTRRIGEPLIRRGPGCRARAVFLFDRQTDRQTAADGCISVHAGASDSYSKPGSAWWRRRELNPRPKQLPPRLLRACTGFWFSLGGSSRRDPLLPATVTVLPQGRGAPAVAIRSM